jgi:hypothetical protein
LWQGLFPFYSEDGAGEVSKEDAQEVFFGKNYYLLSESDKIGFNMGASWNKEYNYFWIFSFLRMFANN